MSGSFDFTDTREPLSSCELGPCPRRRERCHLCSAQIEKDEPAAWLRLFSWSQDGVFFFHRGCFERSGWAANYRERYLGDRYSVADFRQVHFAFLRSDYAAAVEAFEWSRAVDLILAPPFAKAPVYFGNREALELRRPADGGADPHRDTHAPGLLFSLLVKCGFKQRLLEALPGWPAHAQVLAALHDDRTFAESIGERCGLPDLVSVIDLAVKPRQDLDDMLALTRLGEDGGLRRALWAAIDTYELYESYALPTQGFTRMQSGLAWGRLCYPFIAHPDEHAILAHLLRRAELPSSLFCDFDYTTGYLYRAAVFHCLFFAPEAVDSWLDAMPSQVQFHPSGSPRGFIGDTARMVRQYRKRNRPRLAGRRGEGSGV